MRDRISLIAATPDAMPPAAHEFRGNLGRLPRSFDQQDHMPRRSLPQVMVPVPCHVDWNGMMRIDREGLVRFCDSCDKPVYDSRSMTRTQMRDLITRHEGPGRCMRLHVRPDGTIVTRDCFAPLLRLGRLLWLKTALLGMTFWAAAFGLRPLVQRISRTLSEPRVLEMREMRVVQGVFDPRPPPPRKSPARGLREPSLPRPRAPGDGLTPRRFGLLEGTDVAPPPHKLAANTDLD